MTCPACASPARERAAVTSRCERHLACSCAGNASPASFSMERSCGLAVWEVGGIWRSTTSSIPLTSRHSKSTLDRRACQSSIPGTSVRVEQSSFGPGDEVGAQHAALLRHTCLRLVLFVLDVGEQV